MPCDPLIYVPVTDPSVPAVRSVAGIPASDIVGDIAICNELGVGMPAELKPIGVGSGQQSPMKICASGASARCNYREFYKAIGVGGDIMIAEDLGSYPKNQYINISEIIIDLDTANMFILTVSRLDRSYVLLLKSLYHKKSSDGERDCVGTVDDTAFGDIYLFTDGTSDEGLSELPAGRNFEIDEIPNHGRFIFEVHPVNGKPTTDSIRTIYLMVEYTGSANGTIDLSFVEFFDYLSVGGGSTIVDEFVFNKPRGFDPSGIVKSSTAFNLSANSTNLYQIVINNPTMYVVDSAYDATCIPNYNQVVHNRYSETIILNKIL